jgi:hypothetical protein
MVSPGTDPASIFDIADDDAEARALAEAETELADGKGVSHADARKWLKKLANGEDVPPPCK